MVAAPRMLLLDAPVLRTQLTPLMLRKLNLNSCSPLFVSPPRER